MIFILKIQVLLNFGEVLKCNLVVACLLVSIKILFSFFRRVQRVYPSLLVYLFIEYESSRTLNMGALFEQRLLLISNLSGQIQLFSSQLKKKIEAIIFHCLDSILFLTHCFCSFLLSYSFKRLLMNRKLRYEKLNERSKWLRYAI